MLIRVVLLVGIVQMFAGCTYDTSPSPALPHKFSDIQRQTLNPSCAYAGCHADGVKGPFLWLNADSAYNQLLMSHQIENDLAKTNYKKLVVPFQPDSSFLVMKLTMPVTNDYGDPMPSRLSKLPQNQIDAIIAWIKEGAPNN